MSAPRYGIGDFFPFLFSSPLSLFFFSLGTRPFYVPALPKFVLANYFPVVALSGRRKFGIRRTDDNCSRLFPFLALRSDIDLSLLIMQYNLGI